MNQRTFPFKLTNLNEVDMEILNGTEIWDELQVQDCTMPANHGVLICSSSDDSVGVGSMLVIPFDEIIELGRTTHQNELYVQTNTTEGEAGIYLFDFRVI